MDSEAIPMRDALLNELWQRMAENPHLFFVTADFGSPVLDRIRADFPDRFVNVGIAEQNLINISAGLALEGFCVFAYAIASFITMRCYEQIRISLALLSEVRPLNVNLIGVGAGYSYVVSGPTHQCYEDITLMRALPTLQVYSPSDHLSAAALVKRCINEIGPKYLRLDAQVLPEIYGDASCSLQRGFRSLRHGRRVCLVATGYMVHTALNVAEQLCAAGEEIGVVDIFDITGFDREKFGQEIRCYQGMVSLEEGFRGRGGLDALLFEYIARQGLPISMLNIGVEPGYSFELGTRQELHEKSGIGPLAVKNQISQFIQTLPSQIKRAGNRQQETGK